jgi:hypothetical protein
MLGMPFSRAVADFFSHFCMLFTNTPHLTSMSLQIIRTWYYFHMHIQRTHIIYIIGVSQLWTTRAEDSGNESRPERASASICLCCSIYQRDGGSIRGHKDCADQQKPRELGTQDALWGFVADFSKSCASVVRHFL